MSTQQNDVCTTNARISPDTLKMWYEAFNGMTSAEIIEVEYLGINESNVWKVIYANRNNNAGGKLCTICDIVLMNTSHIIEHNNGKKHRGNVEIKVRKFRHQSINPEKLTIVINPCAKNNSNEHEIKEMKEKLRNKMTNMDLIDMELIEYKFSNIEWTKLLLKNDVGYVCNMCKSYTLINLKIIRNHLQTAKHKNNLDLLQGLYHPTISPIKDLLEPPVKINDDMVKNPFCMTGLQQKALDLIEKHAEINVDLLLQIEIQPKLNDNWEKLISKPNNTNQCTCTLCKINIVGIVELRKHLRLDSHVKNMKNVNGIHHPILASLKSTAKIAPTKENTESVKSPNVTPIKEVAESVKTVDLSTKKEPETNKIPPVMSIKSTVPTTMGNSIKPSVTPLKTTASATKVISEPVIVVNQKPETMKNSINPTPIKDCPVKAKEKSIHTDIEFRSIIPTLSNKELTAIEFYKKNVWQKMIIFVDRSYNCGLCHVTKISNISCLLEHLKGKKHIGNMSTVTRFYHPTKTISKDVQNVPSQKVEFGKSIPSIDTSTKPKEQRLPKTPQKNSNNSNDNNKIIRTIEIITVEDSPEKEIIIDKQSSTSNTVLKEKDNIDNIKKSIDKEQSTKILNSKSNNNKVQNQNKSNNSEKEKVINNENIVSQNLVVETDKQLSKNNGTKDGNDIVIVTKETDKIVLNPAAVIVAKNLNKTNKDTNSGPQYQQNRIITPRQSSTAKLPSKPTTATTSSSTSSVPVTGKSPNFSTKSFTTGIDDNNIEGLIGVEFVVKIIQHAADDSPRFECCLCEIELGGVAMQNHLRNLKHRLKYLDRHFQTCIKQYKDYRNDGIIMTEIVDRISKAIEKYHGRDLPYECVQTDYRRNRQDIMSKVFSFRHASELSGPSFTNIVDKNAVEDIIRNKHKLGDGIPDVDKRKTTFDKQNIDTNSKRQRIHSPKKNTIIPIVIPPVPKQNYPFINLNQQNILMPQQQQAHPQFPLQYNPAPQRYQIPYNPIQASQMNSSLDDAEHRRLSENFIKNTKLRDTRSPPLSKRRLTSRRQRSRTPPRHYERSRSPHRRQLDRDRRRTPSRSPLREGDVWQAFRRKFDIDVKIIDLDYQGYIKDPQSYPLYNDEWQNFWAKRMTELKAEGKDHQSHDFTSEWALYFPRRLKDLHEIDVEELKVRLRERFVLPMHNRELKDKRYFVKGNYEDNEPVIEDAPMPPIINYQNYSKQRRQGSESRTRSRSRSNSRSRSSTGNTNFKIKMEQPCEILSSDDDTAKNKAHKIKKQNDDDDDRIDFGPLTICSVLRLLTALEDNLGSLGPRVVDLLSKALTLQKIKPNQSDEILLTAENCVFLETCSEKLKGQVLAGVISTTKLRVVRQAIKDINALVTKTNEERAKKPVSKPPILRKPQLIVQKTAISASASKVQGPPIPVPNVPKVNTNTQMVVGNKQPVQQTQHPTTMSQVQKKELASKLAAALAAQGKTDISTTNCERLIDVYAMIDKKKSETGNRSGDGDKQSLSDTLTDILSSGNLSALTKLFQSNKQQQQTGTSANQLTPQNQYLNSQQQAYQNITNTNFNSPQNHFNNNFNQLANFDTSLNIRSAFNTNTQYHNPQNQMNVNNAGIQSATQIWQNRLPQGNNQNWISGNDITQQQQLNQLRDASNSNRFALNQSNNQTNNLLSQTLLNATQTRNNANNNTASRIDTGAQNSPAYATGGASYMGNSNNNNNNNTNNNNNNLISYPTVWHRQNQIQQQISNMSSGNRSSAGSQQNTNRYGSNNDARNLANSSQNSRSILDTIQTRRSDFGRR